MTATLLRAFVVMGGLIAGLAATEVHVAGGSAVFEVDSPANAPDDQPGDGICATTGGDCTLRAAIEEANVLPGQQIVRLPTGEVDLSTTPVSGDLTLIGSSVEESVIAGSRDQEPVLSIETGASVAILGLTIDGSEAGQGDVFAECGGAIGSDGSLTLTNVAIRNFNTVTSGGGICNTGTLTVEDSVLESNRSARAGAGGALYNSGDATLIRVAILGNHSDVAGAGAVANYEQLEMYDSLIAGNSTFDSRQAAGLGNDGLNAHALVVNSTISGNISHSLSGSETAPDYAGGVSNVGGGTVVLINSTVTANSASGGPGGGIGIKSGEVTLVNTVVAGNEGAECANDDQSIAPDSLGHNIAGDHTCELSGPGDVEGADAMLGPLADNGGPTMTHELLPGSPAIDAGDDAECPEADQRGAPRPVDGDGVGGAVCDIGAYEAGGVVPSPGPVAGDVDCDELLTVLDGLDMLRVEAGVSGEPGCYAAGNLDCDGDVDSHDVLLVFRKLAGLAIPPCAGVMRDSRSG